MVQTSFAKSFLKKIWNSDVMQSLLGKEPIKTRVMYYHIVSTHCSFFDHANQFVPSPSLTSHLPAIKPGSYHK